MTVGVPEINLDTWGLRYVKKKSSTEGIDQPKGSDKPYNPKTERTGQSAPTERTGVSAHSSFESGKPSGNIQATNRISDADVKTPESPKQVHGTQGSDKKRQYTHGKEVPVGSKTGIEVGASEKLTPRGDKQPRDVKNPKGVASGREASHESGIQSIETRTGKNIKGEPVDPEKKTRQPKSGLPDNTQRSPKHESSTPKGSGTMTPTQTSPEHKNPVPTGSGAPKIKAEMELAIIKCKLLKMNDISKRGEWDHLPHAQKEEEENETKKGFGGSERKYGTENTGSIGVDDDPKPTPDKQSVKDPPTSQAKDRADESVTSYGEGASGNQHGGKTTHGEAGDKQLNVEGKIGRDVGNEDIKSRASTKSDEIVEKAIELINEAYGEIRETKKYTKEEKDRIEHVTTGEDFDPPTPQKGEHKWVAGNDPHGKPDEYCKTCGKTRTDKDKEAPATTGTVGAANFVYSDVEEKKKYQGESAKDKGKRKRQHNEDIAAGLRSEYHD